MNKIDQIPTVAIVGRPNVGKSTLFNRLTKSRRAIEADEPGTTRDRLEAEISWEEKTFRLVDTAGLFDLKKASGKDLQSLIKESVLEAIEESDLVIFLTDFLQPDDQLDQQIAGLLRRSGKEVILVVNKCDNLNRIKSIDNFGRLGNWSRIGISAGLRKNLDQTLDLIIKSLTKRFTMKPKKKNQDQNSINLAILGRPNVGKSTLFNILVGAKKRIVCDQPGTTRDSGEAEISYQEKKIIISDTAGILRSKKAGVGLERFSLIRTLKAIENADICLLIMDPTEGVTAIDKKIAGYVTDQGRSLILVFNKCDLVGSEEDRQELIGECQKEFNYLPYVPLIFISATEKKNLKIILRQTLKVIEERFKRIQSEELSDLKELMMKNFGQLPTLIDLSQSGINPPEFSLKIKKNARWHFSFSRFFENRLRDNYPFVGTPIKIKIVN